MNPFSCITRKRSARLGIAFAALAGLSLPQTLSAEDNGDLDVMLIYCQRQGGTITDLGNGVRECCIPNWGCVACGSGGWSDSLSWCTQTCTTSECCRAIGRSGSLCTGLWVEELVGGAEDESFVDPDSGSMIIDGNVLQDEPAPRSGRDLQLPPELLDDLAVSLEAPLWDDDGGSFEDECHEDGGLYIDLGNDVQRCCTPGWGCRMCIGSVCISECWTPQCCQFAAHPGDACIEVDIPEPPVVSDNISLEELGAVQLLESPATDDESLQTDSDPGLGAVNGTEADHHQGMESGASDPAEAERPAVQRHRRGRLIRSR
jgi:hypothetical protein